MLVSSVSGVCVRICVYLTEVHASYTVTHTINRWGPAHHSHNIRNYQKHGTRHSWLSWQAHLVERNIKTLTKRFFRRNPQGKHFTFRACLCICGRLTWKANWPEKSFMPQECMRQRVFLTASPLNTCSPVIGQIPPLARVAAMTLPDSQLASMEHSWKETEEQT